MATAFYGRGVRISIAIVVLLLVPASVKAQVFQFDIPRQEAVKAIPEFALQAGIQIIAPAAGLSGIFTPELRGSFELREGLLVLLQDTDLEIASDDGGVITLRRRGSLPGGSEASGTAGPESGAGNRNSNGERDDPDGPGPRRAPLRPTADTPIDLEKITVTGTRIRGARHASPMVTISGEEMKLAGHTNLGEVARALPQNFSGGQNPGVMQGATGGGFANQNVTGASSFNLRGLGPDATLSLMNGARLPYDGFFQATDVAVVPLAAIDRVEVLLDGASAIYGSDAVGGVANVVLRRDFSGATLSARYGTATSGGFGQRQFTGVGGGAWRSGSVLVAGESSRSDPIRARHRGYLGYMPNQDVMIYPKINHGGLLVSGYQELGGMVEVSVDAFYTERRMDTFDQQTPLTFSDHTDSTIWGVSPAVTFSLPADWSLRAHAFYGSNERDGDFTLTLIPTGQALIESSTCYCNEALSIGLEAEGGLFDLRGGQARISVGAGYRKNEFEQIDLTQGSTFISGTRSSRYGFGEINLPFVSGHQNLPGVHRFSLNGAVRHEDYGSGDFGSVTTPKAGLLWDFTAGFGFRASWGKSFKTPTLVQQNQDLNIVLSPAATFGVDAPEDAVVLRTLGGNPELGPERAEILTAGFVINPVRFPDLSLEVTGFHIDYTDRVTTPVTPFTAALTNPAFAEFVISDPTAAQQAAAISTANQFLGEEDYDPASVIAVIFNHNINVARQKVKGVDVFARYGIDGFGGRFTATGSASWIDSRRRLTPLSPSLKTSGVIHFPASFRARSSLSWARGGLILAGHVNYIDGVKDTNTIPSVGGASMTTVDAVANYGADFLYIGRTQLNLALTNLFNRRPPNLDPAADYLVNYDSTNYSPIGRVVSLAVAKEF